MKIDRKKLKAAIHQSTVDIRSLKSRGLRGSAHAMKLQATRLHALAAHSRGRIHLASRFLCNPRWLSDDYGPYFVKERMSLEEQGKFIAPLLEQFQMKEEAPLTTGP